MCFSLVDCNKQNNWIIDKAEYQYVRKKIIFFVHWIKYFSCEGAQKKKTKKKLVFLGFYKNRKKKGERKKLLQKIIKIRNHTKM